MISFTSDSFTDCEVNVGLPGATKVYCVQTCEPWPDGQPGADWAWDEPLGHYICELKDPESKHGLEDDDGIEKIVSDMDAGTYYWGLVNQLEGTLAHHGPSQSGARGFFALVCIDGVIQPDWGAAIDSFSSILRIQGHDIEAAIVNLTMWDEFLEPRKAWRVPLS